MNYLILKHIHVTFVTLSVAGFLFRSVLALRHSPFLKRRLVRILPHIVDTVLLLSALAMLVQRQELTAPPAWVWAKIFGLLVYIAAGVICLRPGTSSSRRIQAFICALAALGWIFYFAFQKTF